MIPEGATKLIRVDGALRVDPAMQAHSIPLGPAGVGQAVTDGDLTLTLQSWKLTGTALSAMVDFKLAPGRWLDHQYLVPVDAEGHEVKIADEGLQWGNGQTGIRLTLVPPPAVGGAGGPPPAPVFDHLVLKLVTVSLSAADQQRENFTLENIPLP